MSRKFNAVLSTLVALAMFALLVPAWNAGPEAAPYPTRPELDKQYPSNLGKTFQNYAVDTLVTNVPKLLSTTVFTQIRGANLDTLRIISSSTADSTYIVLYGITSADTLNTNLAEERLRVSGTDTVFSTKKWAAFEIASADTESAGTITIVAKRYGTVTTMLPGRLTADAAHHFTGSRNGGVLAWAVALDTLSNAANPNAQVRCELRIYRDYKDLSATPETGYYVADRANLSIGSITATVSSNFDGRTGGRSFVNDWGLPVMIPKHGAAAIFAASSSGSITSGVRVSGNLVGYDAGTP